MLAICFVGPVSAQTVIMSPPPDGRYYACWDKDRYDEIFTERMAEAANVTPRKPATRDLQAAVKAGECFFLKTGERVFVVHEDPPYFPDVELRREGEFRTFWTVDTAVARPMPPTRPAPPP